MKILIAPLNWGLGHATRCIPIVRQLLAHGHEVVLAGNGGSFFLFQQHFPHLRTINLPSFEVKYSHSTQQIGAMFRLLPHLIYSCFADYFFLRKLLKNESFDQIISDNRFGLWNKHIYCIYITHQLMVKMPKRLTWIEPIVWCLHGIIIKQYNECWIPDMAENNGLSGDLSHKYRLPNNAKFIGILSRFSSETHIQNVAHCTYDVVALLSGIEPQRAIFEQNIITKYQATNLAVLIVQGKPTGKIETLTKGNITMMSHIDDKSLRQHLLNTPKIISRSGYSSIMDFAVLGILDKVEFVPTPGQTEQEYLADYLKKNTQDILRQKTTIFTRK